MKHLIRISAVLAVFLLALGVGPAMAGTIFSIEASTYPVTEAATIGAQISGTVYLSNITVSNSGTTAQTVTFYKLAASTTTVSAIATFVVPATAGFYRPFGDQNYNDMISVRDFAIRKSTTATSVYITGLYQ